MRHMVKTLNEFLIVLDVIKVAKKYFKEWIEKYLQAKNYLLKFT